MLIPSNTQSYLTEVFSFLKYSPEEITKNLASIEQSLTIKVFAAYVATISPAEADVLKATLTKTTSIDDGVQMINKTCHTKLDAKTLQGFVETELVPMIEQIIEAASRSLDEDQFNSLKSITDKYVAQLN